MRNYTCYLCADYRIVVMPCKRARKKILRVISVHSRGILKTNNFILLHVLYYNLIIFENSSKKVTIHDKVLLENIQIVKNYWKSIILKLFVMDSERKPPKPCVINK